MRHKIIAGNWKMHKTTAEAVELINEIRAALSGDFAADVVVCPTFTALYTASSALKDSGIKLGAQNMFWKDKGAYTGQISSSMLKDVGAEYVILGHSEARGRFGVPEPDFTPEILSYFGESDSTINRKTIAALTAGLVPIVCVGETIDERNAGVTDRVVEEQLTVALETIPSEETCKIVFAYEPVWAIGTGEVCDADEADRVCGVIRSTVAKLFDSATGETVRIQYGGSVKPNNAADLLSRPNIDGALVGGASLSASDFAAIVMAA